MRISVRDRRDVAAHVVRVSRRHAVREATFREAVDRVVRPRPDRGTYGDVSTAIGRDPYDRNAGIAYDVSSAVNRDAAQRFFVESDFVGFALAAFEAAAVFEEVFLDGAFAEADFFVDFAPFTTR